MIGTYVIVRTQSAGVFAGIVEERIGKEITLTGARRLWSWEGAASLSQLAVDGTSKPAKCKFPVEMPRITLPECIEIIQVTDVARASIASVPVWSA